MSQQTKSARTIRAKMKARLATIEAGLQAEVTQLNAVLRKQNVTLPTLPGSHLSNKTLESARLGYDGLWVTTKNYGGSFCLANDSRWTQILDIAGVARDPRAETTFGR